MKNLYKYATICISLLLAITVNAQINNTKLENSLLWEVSGKGLAKPSYLYGTVHMICADDFFVNEKTKKAFEAANELVLEINLADTNELAVAKSAAMGKELLSQKLSKEKLVKLDLLVKRTIGMSVAQLDNYSMATVMSLIAMKSFGCTDLKFYEMEFIEKAKKSNQKILGLETVAFQFQTIENAYNNRDMITMLESINFSETAELVAGYKNENIEAIYNATIDEKLMSEKSKKLMLDNRNINWVAKIPKLMKDKSIFVAVGAAHLAGKYGVINLLREAGYIVKPIMK